MRYPARGWRVAASFAIAVLGYAPSSNSTAAAPGRADYLQYCAACHGDAASPSTSGSAGTLAGLKKSRGAFPAERVRQVIECGGNIAAHGTRGSPVWGTAFSPQASAEFMELYGPRSPFAEVGYLRARERISALVDYLAEIQE